MYIRNKCRLGFYVRKGTWRHDRFAKVTAIQWVEDGKMIKGDPPYFGGFKNPPGHPRAGKIMGLRLVTLGAEWLEGGCIETNRGGTYKWNQVYPYGKD